MNKIFFNASKNGISDIGFADIGFADIGFADIVQTGHAPSVAISIAIIRDINPNQSN
ncbi:MAG: hypothetical protein JST21_15550 [Bacteroidetes bacterium]|nr:hypothetical protein [Bacteroidota bacterium]